MIFQGRHWTTGRTLVLAPLSITTRRLIVNSGKETEIVEWNLLGFDSQLVVQLATSGILHARHGLGQLSATFSWNTQWVRAARVCPHIWECDLLCRTLLEKQPVLGVEEEYRECAVKKTLVDVCH